MDLQRADGPPLILASGSATRGAMLRAAGLRFEQEIPAVDEAAMRDALRAEQVAPADAAIALAGLKAARVAPRHPGEAIVLGADQILTCEGEWFGKPESRGEARAHLDRLVGRRHELTTAAVAFRGGVRVWHHVAVARLWMRPCSPAFLAAYLDAVGEAPLASVGAYQIEGPGAQLLARVEGDRFAILGLPLLEVLELLRTQGVLMR